MKFAGPPMAFLVLFPALVSGEERPLVRLEDLLAEARSRSPVIRAARAEADAAEARVSGSSSPGDLMFEGARKDDFGVRSTMFGLRVNLPFPGSSFFAGRAAALAALASRDRARAAELETVGKVRTAYHRLAAADATLTAAQEARDLFRQAAAVAKARAVTPMRPPSGGGPARAPGAVGMGGGTGAASGATADFLLLEAESARLEIMVAMQENERTIAEASLVQLLGRPREHARFGRAALPDLPEPVFEVTRLEERALAASPRLAAARRDAQAAGATTARMGLMTLPMLSPFYETERADAGGTGNTYGLGLSYPLWFWKPAAEWREAAAMRDAKRAEAAAQEAETLRMVREEASETRAHWRAATNGRDTVVPLLNQAVRSARASYEAGTADVITLLTAIRGWLDANAEVYNQTAHYAEHRAILEWTIGGTLEEVR